MSDVAGGPVNGASNLRQRRHVEDVYRPGRWVRRRRRRSVPDNGTLAARPSSDHQAAADGGDVGVPKRTISIPPEVRLTAAVRPTRDGGLEVLVSWNWAALRDSESKTSGSELFEFTIHWARKTCNVDYRLPHCDDPDAYYINTVWSQGPKVRAGQTMPVRRLLAGRLVILCRKIHESTPSNAWPSHGVASNAIMYGCHAATRDGVPARLWNKPKLI